MQLCKLVQPRLGGKRWLARKRPPTPPRAPSRTTTNITAFFARSRSTSSRKDSSAPVSRPDVAEGNTPSSSYPPTTRPPRSSRRRPAVLTRPTMKTPDLPTLQARDLRRLAHDAARDASHAISLQIALRPMMQPATQLAREHTPEPFPGALAGLADADLVSHSNWCWRGGLCD